MQSILSSKSTLKRLVSTAVEHVGISHKVLRVGVKLADLLCDRISRPETQSTIPKSNL